MATLVRKDGHRFQLVPHTRVGRAPSAHLRLTSRGVSFDHAVLHYLDGVWHVRDLASRNGTFLNGKAVPGAERCSLEFGDVLTFGDGSEEWRLEAHDESSALCAEVGHIVETSATGTRASLAETRLLFSISPNGEDVGLTLDIRGKTLFAGYRAFFHALFALAEARLADRKLRISKAEEGWRSREELRELLGTCNERLNVDLHRARRLLEKFGIADASAIVARRPNSLTLRLGTGNVEIVESAHGFDGFQQGRS